MTGRSGQLTGSPTPFGLIEDPLQPPGTRVPVSVDIAHQAVGGPQGHVVARNAFLPPVGFDAPATQLLHDSVAMARDDQSDELTLVPYELRGKWLGKESHAITSMYRDPQTANFVICDILPSVAKTSAILTLRRNGQITLPSEVRRRMRASEGDVFVAEVRTPDEIVLRKKSLVDASQAYFWTEEWQRGEREAQEDIRHGRVKRFRSTKALVSDLKR